MPSICIDTELTAKRIASLQQNGIRPFRCDDNPLDCQHSQHKRGAPLQQSAVSQVKIGKTVVEFFTSG